MDMTKEVKGLALHALATLFYKVEAIGPQEENFAKLRNIQKSIEAIMETIEPEPIDERAYCASDFGWKAGEWPTEFIMGTGEHIHRKSKNFEMGKGLISVSYVGTGNRAIEIFND